MNFRKHFQCALALAALLFPTHSLSGQNISEPMLEEAYSGLPFRMEKVSLPKIPDFRVNLRDFGAVGDGIDINTEAFAKAVNFLSEKGGGHLDVPAGIWLTGPIELKSHIDLHLESNAVILFDPSLNLYPIIKTSFEGLDTRRCESPIHAEGQTDISITGDGIIDGSGDAWRPLKKSKVTSSQWKTKVASGGCLDEKKSTWYPGEAYLKGMALSENNLNVPLTELSDETWEEIKVFLRPVMVSLRNCENILLEGVTFQNSPAWNIHPLLCRNLIINHINVRNPWYAQNGDGIDIESCENTVLMNSTFDVGDDGICIKSGKDADGRKRGIPTKKLIVKNCTVFHGHGGFVVGSEMSGGVEDIMVSECSFLGTDVGLRFKSKRGRGGVVRNIYISDIYMTDIPTEAILFDLHYQGLSASEVKAAAGDSAAEVAVGGVAAAGDSAAVREPAFKADETTPAFRDIHIKNIVGRKVQRAMYFNGLPEMPVKNINVSDCAIQCCTGVEVNWAENVHFRNVSILPDSGEAIKTTNTAHFANE